MDFKKSCGSGKTLRNSWFFTRRKCCCQINSEFKLYFYSCSWSKNADWRTSHNFYESWQGFCRSGSSFWWFLFFCKLKAKHHKMKSFLQKITETPQKTKNTNITKITANVFSVLFFFVMWQFLSIKIASPLILPKPFEVLKIMPQLLTEKTFQKSMN